MLLNLVKKLRATNVGLQIHEDSEVTLASYSHQGCMSFLNLFCCHQKLYCELKIFALQYLAKSIRTRE